MPFIKQKLYAPTKIKAFLLLMNELNISQKEAQRLIAKGRVFVDSEPLVKTGAFVEGEIEVVVFKPSTQGLKPTFESEHFVVFDKPSGVLIHPQNRYTKYSLVDELRYQYGKEANITHRIDQETSGLVLCAKSKQSEIDIKMLFENRAITKKYLALVHGKIEKALFIDEPLLRQKHHMSNIRTIVIVDQKGKPSQTSVKPLEYFPYLNMTLVEASPLTGRQHQIRVHLFHVKHPIVGDPLYGQSYEDMMKYFDRILTNEQRIKNTKASRLLLHANELEFSLYNEHFHIKSSINFKDIALQNVSCETNNSNKKISMCE